MTIHTVRSIEHSMQMLSKYAHRWGQFPSARMQEWQIHFDSAKNDSPAVWHDFCAKNNVSLGCDAGDILA